MSEITKLYENAGIEYGSCQNYNRLEQCCNSPFCDSGMCPYGISGEKHPFTAEKQIELIKWLCKRGLLNVMYSEDKNTYQFFNNKCAGSFCSDLATAIATLVQCELDFCTKEEKQQVKGILE